MNSHGSRGGSGDQPNHKLSVSFRSSRGQPKLLGESIQMFFKTLTAATLAVLMTGSFASESFAQSGMASWYGPGFHGRRTASGETFNTHALTAAHRTLPFGTRVLVTNNRTGRSVVVRINDRGPFHGGRIIDLSKSAAQAIGMDGTASVNVAPIARTAAAE